MTNGLELVTMWEGALIKRMLEYLPCNNVDGKKSYMPLKNAAPDLER